ncbi:SGNH/GDSL hydrolase family protein [Sphingomonas sp. ERG5]|uniref:SGNH/GDSL hydrolase family protein n=1 Tax=Sphingomonas sp. ERG5 TaxID=1381597 RepID=UPI00126A38D0|nr:SGNH/GDSL hydrolase family protein [Sphingomonas sp. ERG5]
MIDPIAPSPIAPPPKARLKAWLPLLVGALLALSFLEYARTHILIRLAYAGFGAETSGFAQRRQITQCSDAIDSDRCVATWSKAGKPPVVLWFGNSQLSGINRYRPGDVNAPELLRRALAERGKYLVTYSQPNANLTEEAIVWNAVAPIYRPKLLILPVCYDDIRELGVRETVGDFIERPGVTARLESQRYWPLIAGPMQESLKASSPQVAKGHQSLQTRVEHEATGFLAGHWPLWRAKPSLRGTLGFAVHTLRNKVLGIHSTSKRPVDANVYRDRMELLDGMVADARAQGVDVLLYVPPYRQDIDGPYPMAQYRAFKTELEALAKRHGAGFADIDPIVPGPEWATVTDELFGFKEADFMHFTAAGHKHFAAGIDQAARRMGY